MSNTPQMETLHETPEEHNTCDIELSKDEIDDLLKDDYENIVEEPQLVNKEKLDLSNNLNLLDQISKMNPQQRNNLINYLAQQNINSDNLDFNSMSKEEYLRRRLKQRIGQLRVGRMSKSSRTNYANRQLAKMQKKEENSTEEKQQDSRDIDDLVAEIEGGTSQTQKKKKKKNKKNKKLNELKKKLENSSNSEVSTQKTSNVETTNE